jgi:hypothetical protein
MALEALDWPDPPASTDLNDDATYTMGIRFTVSEAVPCPGVEWSRVPDSVSTPPVAGAHLATLWDAGSEEQLAAAEFTPIPGTLQQIIFDTPVPLIAGPTYVAAVHTRHYVFRNGGGEWPTSLSGILVSDQGKLVASDDPDVYPSGTFGTPWYYVSPIIDLGGDEEHDTTGTAALAIAGSAAVATSRPSLGTAELTVTGAATRSTSRSTTGRAEIAASASAARSSVRVTSGTARALFDARGAQVRSGGGPRLVTVGRASRLTSVTRPSAISTSTRG